MSQTYQSIYHPPLVRPAPLSGEEKIRSDLIRRVSELKEGQELNVSGFTQKGLMRKIRSPKRPELSRVNFGGPQLGGQPIVADNAEDFGRAIEILSPGKGEIAKRNWEKAYQAHLERVAKRTQRKNKATSLTQQFDEIKI